MRYGVFSDVHSNLEALEALCEYYRRQHIERFIFIGDAVGYGADPRRCIEILKQMHPLCVAGNHEWGLLEQLDLSWFNSYARYALLWTRKRLEASDLAYLSSFNLIYQEKDFVCVHASLKAPKRFKYILSLADAACCFNMQKKRVCFIGHSHRAGIFCEKNGRFYYENKQKLILEPEARYIVNVGSVGQPRDANPLASCCIYDSDKNVVEFRRIEYNIAKAAEKIQAAGLPLLLAQRLFRGW